MNEHPAVAAVIDALQMLAADGKDQIAAFPSFVVVADEIACNLNDALLLLQQDADTSGLPATVLETIERIDCDFDELSGKTDPAFWTEEALMNDIRWHRFRLAARELLKSLNVPRAVPWIDPSSYAAVRQEE